MPGHRFRRGWAFERHTPEWGRHGRAAGPIRNRGMVTGCGLAVFFWDGQSPGTADAIATAGPRWKSSTPRVRRPGMDRPTIELADVVRGCGAALADRYPLTPGQRR
ncbi:MAG TPA: hypothetical protein VH092_15460, partial [Urbifossiella sp.]|nr:hypothetical protein [Urbifossiella sp.]